MISLLKIQSKSIEYYETKQVHGKNVKVGDPVKVINETTAEEAAKAAKDLEKSKHASEALALSRVQEETKQKEQEVQVKQYEAQIEQMKIEQKRVEGRSPD